MSAPGPQSGAFGQLVKSWRAARRMSQFALALEAGVSSRHLSFIETGRAQPSREMVLAVARALDIPLRERNALLLAAGYAPLYRETDLDAPEMTDIRHVVSLLLERFEPFGAVAVDRQWNVLMANSAYERIFELLEIARPFGQFNLVRLLFGEEGLRPHILNWDEVAFEFVQRIHRDALNESDGASAALLRDVLGTAGTPAKWRLFDVQRNPSLLIPFHMRLGAADVRLFSTITTLGSAQDISLQELRIEAFLPGDGEAERLIRALSSGTRQHHARGRIRLSRSSMAAAERSTK